MAMTADETRANRVPFQELLDLASETVAGKVLSANDEFFAPKENLLKAGPAIFIQDKFTENGKWMDGWETRRRRTAGHDWCIIQLGLPGKVTGINVDTAYFIGNYPEYCSIEACELSEHEKTEHLPENRWNEVLGKVKLAGGVPNLFPISSGKRWTHLRLNIFPDGGVARLRVHGVVLPNWKTLKSGSIDLAAAQNGGTVITCNDMFFGMKDNLILPGRARVMSEGWETRRRRGPGFDWTVIQLGTEGVIEKLEVDTHHFKGNFPDSCSVEATHLTGPLLLPSDFRDRQDIVWTEILPRTPLKGHFQNIFEKELKNNGKPFNYVRLNIFPDGGVSRLRVFGKAQ
jgi:allantoicase